MDSNDTIIRMSREEKQIILDALSTYEHSMRTFLPEITPRIKSVREAVSVADGIQFAP